MGTYTEAQSVVSILCLIGGVVTTDYMVMDMILRKDRAPAVAGAGVLARTAMVPILGGAIYLYVEVAGVTHNAALVFYVVGLGSITAMMIDSVQTAFRSIERMEYVGMSTLILAVTSDVIAIAIIVMGGKALALSACITTVTVAAFILNIWWARRIKRLSFSVNLSDMSSLVTKSLPFWPKQFSMTIYLYVDVVILSLMVPSVVVGWYGVDTTIFGTLLFLPTILCSAWYPRMIAAHRSSVEDLKEEARPLLDLVPAMSVAVAAATAAGAKPIISLFYGPAYEKAVPAMVVLGFCVIPMYMGMCLGQSLAAMKRPLTVSVMLMAGIVLNVILNLILIPEFSHRYDNGALGSAVSFLITESVITAGLLIAVGRQLLDRRTFRRLPGVAAASVALLVTAHAAASIGIGSLALSALAFLVVAAPLRVVSKAERAALVGYLGPRILRRRL